jgi:hypothetical protein
MTTTNYDIQSALNKKLNTLTPSLPINWENTEYTPTIGTSYLRAWLLPGETSTLTLGPNGFNEYVGVLQIDCMYPIGKGWRDAKVEADSLCTLFKRGTLLTYNNINVRVMKSWPEPAVVDGPYYKVSVSVVYTSYDNT